VYALDLCFESVVASFGAPVVGILAERVFGYRPRAPASGGSSAQAAALGKAVFAEVAVPATICCLTYSALYWTYPADRRRARARMMAASLPEASGGNEKNCWETGGPAVCSSSADDGLDLDKALISLRL
jgi:hypothetical protein